MGQVRSRIFTEKELREYQDLTYLTKLEILRAYDKFNSLVPQDQKNLKNPLADYDAIVNIPELKVNPFKDRIFHVFASYKDQMSFEDFLDMISLFNEKAAKAVKTEYIFRIYDFDEDDYLSAEDVTMVIERLVGNNQFSELDMQEIIDNVFAEADLDGDGYLNFAEFEHIVQKLPDFENNFRIHL